METENKTVAKKKAGRPRKAQPGELITFDQVPSNGIVIPTQPTPLEMLNKLVDQSASAEQLQILFNLQQQYEQNQARKEYIAAMNRFKSDPPEIKKSKHVFYNSKSGTVDYWHSDLDDIVSGVSSKLAECGLDMHWETDQGDEGRIKVSCVLTHYLGHTKSVTLYGSPDQSGGKNNIQAVGSTVKYLQRYTAMAVLGLSDSDIDNDAINPSIGDSQPQQTQQQANELPEYPDNLFQQNLPKWRKALSGGKTHSAIINTIKSRYTLTAEQEKKINTLQPEETNGNS